MKNKQGFTLFELLVSISIIAVMTAIAVVSFGGISKKSRDARRMADLEKVRIALEAARQIGNTYPSTLNSLIGSSLLQQIPTDPKDKSAYAVTLANSTYSLSAKMEDVGSTNCTISCGTCNTLPCNYKVFNP